MRIRIAVILCVWMLFSGQVVQAALSGDSSELTNVLQTNWPQWRDGEDRVSYLQLVAQLKNPYQGKDAAALAALAHYLRQTRNKEALTQEAVLQLAKGAALQEWYEKEKRSLTQASHALYAKGQPNFLALQQGPIGDCFFFSGLGWLAHYRPQVIMDSIEALPDGRYKVVFPNGMQVTVDKPTDGEMLFFNSESTITDGIWAPILEKAVGAILPHYTKRVVNEEEPAYNIALGGAPATIEKIWTNKTPHVLYLRKSGEAEARRLLLEMKEKRLLAQALTGKKPPAPSIAGNHVYAIMDFDSARDELRIWNPWGDDFKPLPGHSGYPRQHGIFTLSIKEFCEYYEVLFVE